MSFDRSRHRLQFNIDANVWMYKYHVQSAFYRPTGQPLTAEDIHRYVGIIAAGGVDTLTVNGHCTQLAYYPSKQVPTCIDHYKRGDKSFFFGHLLGCEMTTEQIEKWLAEMTHLMDAYVDLVEAGANWLAETATACREHNIAPWTSLRMNDMHGATKLPEFNFMNCELYKDPAMRLRGTTYNPEAPTSNGYKGFNYAKPEVRDYILSIVRDLVQNYNYEGLQLEWNRVPLCCEPEASQETIDLITEWHAEVRRVTDAQAERIGKHYALGIKYTGTLDQMRSIGLDLRAMVEQGIIDFVSPTNSWQSSWDIPCDELRHEFGPDVAIYGAIEFCPNYLFGYIPGQKKGNPNLGEQRAINYRLTPHSPPTLHGNAASKLVLGVDGIECYNFPCADQVHHSPWDDEPLVVQYSALKNIDDLESLRGKPKFYTQSSQVGCYISYPNLETMGVFPTLLGPGERRVCRIPMCAEPENGALEFVIQIVVDKCETLPIIGVYFNGLWPRFDGVPDERLVIPIQTMTHHTPEHIGLNFMFPLSSIREGWNEIVVMNGAPAEWWRDQREEAVRVHSLEIAVREK